MVLNIMHSGYWLPIIAVVSSAQKLGSNNNALHIGKLQFKPHRTTKHYNVESSEGNVLAKAHLLHRYTNRLRSFGTASLF